MDAEPQTEVTYEVVQDHIALITLNRPQVRNAINGAIASALDAFAKRTEADEAIRVVVLASSSPRAFCAGADLATMAAGRAGDLYTLDGGFAGMVDAIRAKPWIAAVEGFALAGGCELALACDMVVASSEAKFGLPEVSRGLFAAAGGVHRLARAIPRNVALELIATGEAIGADRAFALGLVNRLVAAGAVLDEALRLAATIAANAPLAVKESLTVARAAAERSDADLRKLSQISRDRVRASEDAKEGPRAFLEKRKPNWTGR